MRTFLPLGDLAEYLQKIQTLTRGFDLLGDHVVITDADANILYANTAVEKNTGFSPGEAVGKNPADLWGGKMPKEFYEKMWHTIKIEKKPFVGEVRNTRKDGAVYWQELRISPVLDEHGEVKFFIGIEPNITQRKAGEKSREEFLSILGHQLSEPMTAFKWLTEWLSGQNNLTKEQRDVVDTLSRYNDSLIDLVGDILVFARTGNFESEKKENIDLAKEIQSIIGNAKTSNPRVSFSFQIEAPFVIVSPKQLAVQIFTNIIFNAAEYVDKMSGKIELTLAQEGENYIFLCKDNGIGIPEEERQKIFSKFFRASNAREVKKNGNGLGLFIVKLIAEGLGWNVTFQSKVGEGTTFRVEIPKNQSPNQS